MNNSFRLIVFVIVTVWNFIRITFTATDIYCSRKGLNVLELFTTIMVQSDYFSRS